MADNFDYQRQLDYEQEIERREYERQLRLEEDERQRELELEKEQDRQRQLEPQEQEQHLEEEERQRQLEWEQEQERQYRHEFELQDHASGGEALSQLRLNAAASGSKPKRGGWNWRWARRSREEEYRRVRENDKKRWGEKRRERQHQGALSRRYKQWSFISVVAIGAGVFLAGFFLVKNLSFFQVTATTAQEMATPVKDSAAQIEITALDILDKASPVESDPIEDIRGQLDELASNLIQVEAMFSTFSQKLQNLRTEFDAVRDEIGNTQQVQHTWKSQVQQHFSQFDETLAGLQAKLEQQSTLSQRINQLDLQVKALQQPPVSELLAKSSDIKAKSTLPFRLVSIDFWNNVPYATVSRQGRLEKAAVGEFLSGWLVAEIDISQRRVIFDQDGRQLAQTVTR